MPRRPFECSNEQPYHLVASFPQANLSEAMNYFMRETSRVIGFESDRINHVYGGRVFRSRLTSFHHYQNVYKYVYRNSVQAKICDFVEAYPFSTIHGLLGFSGLQIPIEEDTLFFSTGAEETSKWLNRRVEPDDVDAIRKALRHPDFQLPSDPKTRRMHKLETQLI